MLTTPKPAFCASIAQASPVGPAPTTTTSHDSLMRLQTTRIDQKAGDAAADSGVMTASDSRDLSRDNNALGLAVVRRSRQCCFQKIHQVFAAKVQIIVDMLLFYPR